MARVSYNAVPSFNLERWAIYRYNPITELWDKRTTFLTKAEAEDSCRTLNRLVNSKNPLWKVEQA
jgi:hypothetical protein